MTKHKIAIYVFVAVVAVAVSPFVLLFVKTGYASIRERLHRIPFDSAAWQDPKRVYGDDPVRIRMVDDLIDSKRLDHQMRAQVIRLLGNPPKTEYFKEFALVYWLGPERGFLSIDSEWLVIDFDSEGHVREYRIVRD